MGRYREKTSTILTRLTHGHGRKRHPSTGRSSVHQTSLIFELPDELILSILSYVSPEPQFAGHYARLRLQYGMVVDDYHHQRTRFLLSLSMTCRTMHSRLRSWAWERVECPELITDQSSGARTLRKLNIITKTLFADRSLATSVRFVMLSGVWNNSSLPGFIKCLGSLPNLHTLEIGQVDYYPTPLLRSVLGDVELPQIKALILPPTAYPLLGKCPNVEEVVCVSMGMDFLFVFDEFCESLVSNPDSKVKRLTIPLISSSNPSRYLVALPRLTELTVLYPHPDDTPIAVTGIRLDVDELTRSATSELVDACKALPDFDTFQIVQIVRSIVHLPSPRGLDRWLRGHRRLSFIEQRNPGLKDQVGGLKDWAAALLKQPRTGCWEEEGRKRTALRVIELSTYGSLEWSHLDSLIVEECEV